jgi:hypothetical protein
LALGRARRRHRRELRLNRLFGDELDGVQQQIQREVWAA